MRRVAIHSLIVILAVFMSGCFTHLRSVRPSGSVVQEFHVADSFAESWEGLLEGVMVMRLPIETADKDVGIITTSFVRMTPAEAAKLSYHSAVYTYELLDYCQYRVTIHVKSEAENQTRIRINPYYEGFYIEEGASKPIVLRSNGSLEQKIIDRLSQPAENLSSTR
ncbi:MAG: hypothetical protein O7D32_10685 [bacterium]|nr:hypothetical protein [bacterium]